MRTPSRTRRLAIALAAVSALAGACANTTTPPTTSSSPSVVTSAVPSPILSQSPSPLPTASPLQTDTPPPSPSIPPSPTPRPPSPTAVATRIVIPSLGIDLAIVKSPPAGVYPYCNVAMSFGMPFGEPGQRRATYLFAHARDGMFGPIYELTMVKHTPEKMVGMLAEVYTSDDYLRIYRIAKVLPHQLSLRTAMRERSDQLWLQTSEGPHGTPGKTQVVAYRVSIAPADHAAAHPTARPVRCGY